MSDQPEKEVQKFLARWSRRKVEARRTDPEEGPPGPPEAAAVPSGPGESPVPTDAPTDAPLPTIEELRGLESEYRDFLRPGVDETLRRTALKKLFQDPHFNVMDGLDTYIDDYSKPDPIPEAMLRALEQAKGLIFDREDERGASEAKAADAAGVQASGLVPQLMPPPVSPQGGEPGDDEVARSGLSKPGAPV